ncbi:MAG: hypothetical protein M1814_003477 [Vezdaea aestivalis]|nr:MAG: hypothetical protein M1814_003477 [Vezdaea aestivalis]
MPKSWTVHVSNGSELAISKVDLPFPIVAKPICGRGSHGLKLCASSEELKTHIQRLAQESPTIMLEEFLGGEKATFAVMLPSPYSPDYWATPAVTRFDHKNGIAPYDGVVAVTANSRVIPASEAEKNPQYSEAAKESENVARLLNAPAPIRVDVRRQDPSPKSEICSNMTGPGRPGREDQASPTAMAVGELGWTYPTLLKFLLGTSTTLEDLRGIRFTIE